MTQRRVQEVELGVLSAVSSLYQRIAVRKDVEPDPPRLLRGFKIAVEDPEDYKDFDACVNEYLEIFKLR